MNASFNRTNGYTDGIIDIMAKEGNQKDIDAMNKVVAILEDKFSYEGITADGEWGNPHNIVLASSDTIGEMKVAYRDAKKMAKEA